MSAREHILASIRASLSDVSTPAADLDVPVDWVYGRPTPLDDVIDTFVERVVDYKAEVIRLSSDQLVDEIAGQLRARGATTVVIPPELDLDVAAEQVVRDDGSLTAVELDGFDAVVTASRVAIAETGTIVLDHAPDQGRRALSLVPDLHLCIVAEQSVVSDVAEAVALLADSVANRLPLTWISGPSATSDIELSRVEGVHGPRTLVVLLVAG